MSANARPTETRKLDSSWSEGSASCLAPAENPPLPAVSFSSESVCVYSSSADVPLLWPANVSVLVKLESSLDAPIK